MRTSDVIEHFGSVMAVARALGISRAAVYLWGDYVPPLRQYELQKMTGGKLSVGARYRPRKRKGNGKRR